MKKTLKTEGACTIVAKGWQGRRIYITGEYDLSKVSAEVRRAASRGADYGYIDLATGEYHRGKLDITTKGFTAQDILALF